MLTFAFLVRLWLYIGKKTDMENIFMGLRMGIYFFGTGVINSVS